MITVTVITAYEKKELTADAGRSLLDILRENGFDVYAPCGGKGACGKCTVRVAGEGEVLSCAYFPVRNIEVVLPGSNKARILVNQTEFLEDVPFAGGGAYKTERPYGLAVDIGTTTLVLYFLDMRSGKIEALHSLLNPQQAFGADVIARINYCQEHADGLEALRQSLLDSLNREIARFAAERRIRPVNVEKIIVAGNTTILHLLLGEDPTSIALAPFAPSFTDSQVRRGRDTGLRVHPEAKLVTFPCLSAYVGGDITAGLAVLKSPHHRYLFIDIGTNGEIALVDGDTILTCAAAAGPAFEGAGLSCGMGAAEGAVSHFSSPDHYQVIGNMPPRGICGSGIMDVIAYLLNQGLVDASGLLRETFVIHRRNHVYVSPRDVREVQLAKSAVFSGMQILMRHAGLSCDDIGAVYLAGGFGNDITPLSAVRIGLLPSALRNRLYPVGNSAGIGALQYLKSGEVEKKIDMIVDRSRYIELSTCDEFSQEFALNMRFPEQSV